VDNPQTVLAAEIAERDALIVALKDVLRSHHHSPALNALATVMAHILAEIPNGAELAASLAILRHRQRHRRAARREMHGVL
jgi:hypothetical protein